jgi:hypothetical protein
MNSPTVRVAIEKKGRRLAQYKRPAARGSDLWNVQTPGRVIMGHEPRRDRVSNPPNREVHRFRRLAVDCATRLHSFEELPEAIHNVQVIGLSQMPFRVVQVGIQVPIVAIGRRTCPRK